MYEAPYIMIMDIILAFPTEFRRTRSISTLRMVWSLLVTSTTTSSMSSIPTGERSPYTDWDVVTYLVFSSGDVDNDFGNGAVYGSYGRIYLAGRVWCLRKLANSSFWSWLWWQLCLRFLRTFVRYIISNFIQKLLVVKIAEHGWFQRRSCMLCLPGWWRRRLRQLPRQLFPRAYTSPITVWNDGIGACFVKPDGGVTSSYVYDYSYGF